MLHTLHPLLGPVLGAALGTLCLLGGEGEEKGKPRGTDATKATAPTLEVVCKTDAPLRGTDILLRDLADVNGADAALVERLLGLSFGMRPAVGFNRVLTQRDVQQRLLAEGLPSSAVQVRGANEIIVQPLFTLLKGSDLEAAAEPVLRAALQADGAADVDIELANALRPERVPPGRRSFDLRARLHDGRLSFASATVDVTAVVDGEPWKTLPVPYRLRRYQEVLVALRAVRRGTPLGADTVELRRTETPAGSSTLLTALDAVAGKVAGRDLQAGQTLRLGDARDPAVIRKGDQVSLVATVGRVRVATRGIALGDGAVGERLLVSNLGTQKVVQGTVHGAGVVLVETGR